MDFMSEEVVMIGTESNGVNFDQINQNFFLRKQNILISIS